MTPSYSSINGPYKRMWTLVVASGLVLAVGAVVAPDRVWSNLLVITYYLVTLGLGGLAFIALANVTGASWHVAFRRIPEAMAGLLPVAGLALLAVLGIRATDYGWHHHGEGGPGTFWFKEFWLDSPFWAARAITLVTLWILFARGLVGLSRQQDQSSDVKLTRRTTRLSALFLVVMAITLSLASIDWIMALKPMWFSTMWGVYHFAGMFQAALAAVIVFGLLLRSHRGPLHGIFRDEHLHDLGKLLLGFSCFWMYIWFSQYMLIWYTNVPEETVYFVRRTHGPWAPILVLSIVMNWGVPFLALLPRPCKRSSSVMMKVALLVLIGRWVDLYIMVFPATMGETPVFGVWEIAAVGCLIGSFGLLFFRSFAAAYPVPREDPMLDESLHYHL